MCLAVCSMHDNRNVLTVTCQESSLCPVSMLFLRLMPCIRTNCLQLTRCARWTACWGSDAGSDQGCLCTSAGCCTSGAVGEASGLPRGARRTCSNTNNAVPESYSAKHMHRHVHTLGCNTALCSPQAVLCKSNWLACEHIKHGCQI